MTSVSTRRVRVCYLARILSVCVCDSVMKMMRCVALASLLPLPKTPTPSESKRVPLQRQAVDDGGLFFLPETLNNDTVSAFRLCCTLETKAPIFWFESHCFRVLFLLS